MVPLNTTLKGVKWVATFLVIALIVVTCTRCTPGGWSRALPPADRPVVGVWTVDGDLTCYMAIRHGMTYFEYAPTLLPPYGAEIFTVDPTWWTEMPGRAE